MTGATGFIGGAVVRSLTASGHSVIGCSRTPPPPGAAWREHIRVDVAAPGSAWEGVGPAAAIVHCAGVAAPAVALAEPTLAFSTNTQGTANILDLARRWECPVVLASSVYVYDGTPDPPWHETCRLAPRSPLGASKVAAEAIAGAYWSSYGVPSVALRLFTVFGPGSSDRQFIPSAVRKIEVGRASGKPVEFGERGSVRDFVYIDDVAAAFDAALRYIRVSPGHLSLNIASGRALSVGDVVDAILALSPGPRPEIRYGALPRRADEPPGGSRHGASIERARDILGWAPAVRFEEGLRRTYERMRGTASP